MNTSLRSDRTLAIGARFPWPDSYLLETDDEPPESDWHRDVFGLWLGTWHGKYMGHTTTWLRFFDSDGQAIPTHEEAACRQAAAARLLADEAKQNTFAQLRRVADAERQRAQAAEAEIARLRKLLEGKS